MCGDVAIHLSHSTVHFAPSDKAKVSNWFCTASSYYARDANRQLFEASSFLAGRVVVIIDNEPWIVQVVARFLSNGPVNHQASLLGLGNAQDLLVLSIVSFFTQIERFWLVCC